LKEKLGDDIGDRYQGLGKTVKGKDALIRTLFKTTRLLYRELLTSNKILDRCTKEA
jgi:hypothetical protein